MADLQITITKLYKTESAKLLAVLTRIFGTHNLELAEDVIQEAFSKALTHWEENGIPNNPSAWIIQIAKNQAIDAIRVNKTKLKFSDDLSRHLESEWSLGITIEHEFQEDKIKDDQLRMIFMCCQHNISPKNRIPFILKTLCGFSIPAIARAMILPEDTIKKRLFRTRQQLKEETFETAFTIPEPDQLIHALDTVHTILYLLFNEGFHSSEKQHAINIEFCQEAIALVNLLINEPTIANQETLALFALMHFHIARVNSRIDKDGFNIPIDLQDRTLWQKDYINTANRFLAIAQSISTHHPGRFITEALIAKEHCQAIDFEKTNWEMIVEYYQTLIEITESPIAELNQAIAIGYTGEITLAIEKIEKLQQHKALKNSHMPLAVLAHLNAKAGNQQQAYTIANKAKEMGGTPREHQLMMQQIERLLNKHQ